MEEEDKEALMNAVLHGNLQKVKYTFKKHKLVVDKSFFDYELLKVALGRKHYPIVNFLLKKNCRVRNTKKNNSEKETAFHLVVKLENRSITKEMLKRGASIYDKNYEGEIPIYTAFKERCYAAVDIILKYCCNLKNLNPCNKSDIMHFHIACIRDNVMAAKLYIKSGFDVNSSLCVDAGKYFPHFGRNVSTSRIYRFRETSIYPGMTPLHFAVNVDFEELVKLLLENGADCNKADKEGNTPLHELCKKLDTRKTMIFKILLEYKANLEALNENGCTPLHLAFYYLNEDQKYIFDMLLSKEPWGPTNFTNEDGLSYFHIACTTSNINQVEKFLDAGVNIDSPVTSGMYSGYTALHFAVLHNQKEVVELLLKRCAQVNIKTSEMEVTPLHLACEYNYVKFYQTNLESNWKPYSVNNPINIDWTLNCQNQLNIIKLLLLYGADVEATDSYGATPLFHAGTFDVDYCRSYIDINYLSIRIGEIIEILLSNNANIYTVTNNQSSLLHIFSENRFLMISEELMKFFVDKGLSVNAVDDAGLTPLHVAAKSGNKYMVKNLIKHNANLNAKSKDSTIPLQILADEAESLFPAKREIVCLLLKYSSKIDIENKRKSTLLHYIIQNRKDPYAIKMLLYYGADINIKDSRGNSPLYYAIDWDFIGDPIFQNCTSIFEVVYSHIQKLLALDLYVSEQVHKLSNKIYQSYTARYSSSNERDVRFDLIFTNCNEEKQRIEHIKIDSDTSLYSILKKSPHELLKYIKNINFVKIIESERIDIDFPLCGHLLKVQYKRALVRREILESAKAPFISAIGFNLPDLCWDGISQYLSNEELECLIKPANIEDMLSIQIKCTEKSKL